MRWRTSEDSAASSTSPTTSSTAAARLDADLASPEDFLQPQQQKTEESSSSEEEKKLDKQDVDDEKNSRVVQDDDDGADHAEETAPPWKPQNVQSTCEFTHTISDYSQKRESGCKKAEYSSTTVDDMGNRWRLIIYVNGNGRASNHHLSLFLQVADADDLPFGWKKGVSYVLTLEHPKGGNLSYAKRNPDKTFKLCPKAIDWGWSQFITSDRIQQEGFVSDDSLTVRASVTVKSSSVSIDEEDSELYLKCAVEEGDVDAVKVCLEHGASVNCQFKDDLYTPLHTACSSGTNTAGSMDVLNLLLQEGADGNACNKWKETPLLIAANNGHRMAVEALLKNGANPSLCSEAGWSALTFAAHKVSLVVPQSCFPRSVLERKHLRPISQSLQGYEDIVALLLRAGAPVNSPVTEDSSTPLHKACAGSKSGHLAAVKQLLDGGADVHALNKWRETPLLTAANHGQAGAVEALLNAGADPCKCTDTGWSPLSIAAYKGHDEVVRLLLEEGAPTEEDDPTLSALLQAATKGLPDTVELLLQHGADHTVTTKKGDTALSILVEQNLIDAAAEMVAEYNASIPRCSRDRKKVQRARLLINLRMKQLEREGGKRGSTNEEESDEEEESKVAQHEELSNEPSIISKKKKPQKSTAEEKARAAEEALLLELEQEETKAKKDTAAANSKRQRKKERKERERQLKLKEEQARKEKEEAEAKERERVQKEKEEKQRKEREQKLIEQHRRERDEMMEREKALAAKRKERQEREQKEREEKMKSSQAKMEQKKASKQKNARTIGSSPKGGKSAVAATSNRRWEKKPSVKSPARKSPQQNVEPLRIDSIPSIPQPTSDLDSSSDNLPKTTLTPRSNSAWNGEQSMFVGTGEAKRSPSQLDQITPDAGVPSQFLGNAIEHPAVSLFRQEKVAELMSRCAQSVPIVDEDLLKQALCRWITRAAHDPSPSLDPIIPSWAESERIIAFFQRQLIAGSRRGNAMPGASMESLKEAGASIAIYCQNVARETDQFRQRIEEHLPKDWTDSDLGMTVSDGTLNGSGAVVTVSWANRAHISLPSSMFSTLRERHVGPTSRFLSSCFMTKSMYDTKRLITGGTTMDFRLSSRTKACLTAVAGVYAELWSDPLTAESANVFWGTIECVDGIFGGQSPFGKDRIGCEEVLAAHGGSLAVLLPFDATVASNYVQQMVDILLKAQKTSVPLSFLVVAHANCFPDLPNGPSTGDMHQLDPRLQGENQDLVRYAEVLPAGQHSFHRGGGPGEAEICATCSLLLVLQNDAGKSRFEISSTSIAVIVSSMSAPSPNDVFGAPIGLTHGFGVPALQLSQPSYLDGGMTPISPNPQRVVRTDFGTIGGASTAQQPFSPGSDVVSRGSRRGRLFDLVDNGEEDDVDLVSGMLNNLDVGLLQDTGVGSDVDIEAISLMGIGGPSSHSFQPKQPQQGRFG